MLDVLFDRLSWRVSRTLKQWWPGQDGPRSFRGSWPERIAGVATAHPVISVLGLIALKLIVATLWSTALRILGLSAPSTWTNTEFSTYFATLWSVQATITALVYPIVIAFVAVLLQRRATAKLSLQLYLLDSAVLPAGISSLGLLGLMGIEYLAVPYVPPEWVALGVAGDGVWFFVNVGFTAWFLYRTVRYLNDDARMQVFTRYAISTALPTEVRSRLTGQVFLHEGHVDEPIVEEVRPSSKPRVHYFPMPDGEPCVDISVRGSKTIVDVRLRLLNIAAKLWMRAHKGKGAVDPSRVAQTGRPLLTITFMPGESISGTETLCTVRTGKPPNYIAAFLIRRSLVLGHAKSSTSTVDIFEELATEVLALLEQRRFEAATETVSALADLHAELIRAGAFIDGDGGKDNAALLAEPYRMTGLRLHQEWVRGYRELVIVAATDANLDTAFYRRCCYLSYRLLNRLQGQHPDIVSYVLNLSTLMSHRLGIWWQSKADEKGLAPLNAENADILPQPLARQYDSALKTFIEAWEASGFLDIRTSRSSPSDAWRALSGHLNFAAEYLRYMLKMLAGAVVRGDRAASLYLVDSLLKWWNSQEAQFGAHPMPEQEFPLHTLSCIDDEWSVVRSRVENLPEGDEEHATAQALASVILRRYWVDARLVAALIFLYWTSDTADESAFSFELAVSLLKGRSYKGGGTVALREIAEFHKLLLHLIRGQVADRRYSSRLDGLASTILETLEPDRLGGRVFVTVGDAGLQSLLNVQVELLLAVAGGRAPFGAFTIDSAVPHWSQDLEQLEQLRDVAKQLREALDWPGLVARLPLVDRVRRALSSTTNADDARVALTNALDSLNAATADAREELFDNAQVANSRLRIASSAVSLFILNGGSKVFPLSIATTFVPVLPSGKSDRLNISNVRKGPFTEPPLQDGHDRAIEGYNKLVAEQVASSVLEKYLRTNGVESLPDTNEELLLGELASRAQRIRERRGTPVVLIPTGIAPAWLRQATDGASAARGVSAFSYRRADDAPSVIGHLGDVTAHAVPMRTDACYLVPLDDFETLTYAAFGGADCVGLEWSPESSETIRLSFLWEFSAAGAE